MKKFKLTYIHLLLSLCITLFFTSCEKENLIDDVNQKTIAEEEKTTAIEYIFSSTKDDENPNMVINSKSNCDESLVVSTNGCTYSSGEGSNIQNRYTTIGILNSCHIDTLPNCQWGDEQKLIFNIQLNDDCILASQINTEIDNFVTFALSNKPTNDYKITNYKEISYDNTTEKIKIEITYKQDDCYCPNTLQLDSDGCTFVNGEAQNIENRTLLINMLDSCYTENLPPNCGVITTTKIIPVQLDDSCRSANEINNDLNAFKAYAQSQKPDSSYFITSYKEDSYNAATRTVYIEVTYQKSSLTLSSDNCTFTSGSGKTIALKPQFVNMLDACYTETLPSNCMWWRNTIEKKTFDIKVDFQCRPANVLNNYLNNWKALAVANKPDHTYIITGYKLIPNSSPLDLLKMKIEVTYRKKMCRLNIPIFSRL